MEQLKAVKFLEQKKEFLFPNKEYTEEKIEEILLSAPDDFELSMNSIPFRKPSTVRLIAVFPGSLGVDRFYLGDIKKGVLKYFTFGGLGVWWIKDIISAKDRCRAYNCKKLMDAINDPSVIRGMQNTDDTIKNTVKTAKAFAPVVKEIVKGAKDIARTNDPTNHY